MPCAGNTYLLCLCVSTLFVGVHGLHGPHAPYVPEYVPEYVPGEDGTYAQNYQDVWFESLARQNDWLPNDKGFYLDLGAFMPLECSNSAKLDLMYSWDGIVVEPRADMGFQEHRPRAVEVNRAMAGISGRSVYMGGPGGQLFQILQDPTDPKSQLTASKRSQLTVTTINARDLISCVNSTAPPDTDCSGVHGTGFVPEFINLVSMDIEGSEADLLQTWPWDLVEVGVFIIETGAGLSSKLACNSNCKQVRRIMQEQGYISVPVQNAGVDEYFVPMKYSYQSIMIKDWRVHPDDSHGC